MASNATYLAFMGFSPVIWGPMSEVFGRRQIILANAVAFTLFSVATSLAPNLPSLFIFRALSAFRGTAFIILGLAVIGDIYRPTERGIATRWLQPGTVIGPMFGNLIGFIMNQIVEPSWKTIFWLQSALAGVGTVAVFCFVPETTHDPCYTELEGLSRKGKLRAIIRRVNPLRTLKLLRFLNAIYVTGGSSALLLCMYVLYMWIQINLLYSTSKDEILFSVLPGIGGLMGAFFGNWWTNRIVGKWINNRKGLYVPEDRLRASLSFFGILIPACVLVIGWSIHKEKGLENFDYYGYFVGQIFTSAIPMTMFFTHITWMLRQTGKQKSPPPITS